MGMADALEGLAGSAVATEQWRSAATLFGVAEVLRERIGVPIPFENQALHDQFTATIRHAVSSVELASAYAEGRAVELTHIEDIVCSLLPT